MKRSYCVCCKGRTDTWVEEYRCVYPSLL
uniref:Uncharacterized protein n=1 Tax=Anguilla anguilla TaxID=7936 RepID=A0A0E9XKF5_ANGAN